MKLPLSETQATKLQGMLDEFVALQRRISIYSTAIGDAHGLQGDYTVVGIEDGQLVVNVKGGGDG